MTRSDCDNVDRHVSSSSLTSSSTPKTTKLTTSSRDNSSIRTLRPARNTVGMILTCLIGLALSGYATYVEIQVEKDDDYRAMCDISEKISCTKVFASRYGKGFGIIGWIFGEKSLLNTPNGELGIVFYIIIGILSFIKSSFASKIQLILVAMSNCMSLYLAYLLYFVLDDLCVVCVGTYAVNFMLLIQAWQRQQSFAVTTQQVVAAKLD